MTPAFDDLPVALPAGCAGVRVTGAADASAWAEAFDWPTELSTAAVSRRTEFLMGRLAAVESLRRLGVDGTVGRSPEGEPVWPAGVAGSLTHHSGVAAAVVGRQATGLTGLGFDVCPRLEGDRLRAVVRKCLTDTERARWAAEDVATLAFAAKESIYKAAYPRAQRFIGFDEAEIVDVGAGTWAARVSGALAREIDVDAVAGTYAWDGPLLYAVLALGRPR